MKMRQSAYTVGGKMTQLPSRFTMHRHLDPETGVSTVQGSMQDKQTPPVSTNLDRLQLCGELLLPSTHELQLNQTIE